MSLGLQINYRRSRPSDNAAIYKEERRIMKKYEYKLFSPGLVFIRPSE
jgi:hypothetical protein